VLRKDKESKRLNTWYGKREVKLKRVQKRRADLQAGIKATKKAKGVGADYGSGMAINDPSVANLAALPEHSSDTITPFAAALLTPGAMATASATKKK
jgi:hypothetical protein